ncbi:hypothetical protein LIZ76_02410 [Caldibacillus sp. 210928-DFI.2.22]|uniref:hypothetical protein n=1 Tax=unclassified Caldibacillus TaxID=2641266 RepID=UPI001D09239D|nr:MULTISPECIES: hypothetical protein [unclassified Caldibacillus]MCB7068822.1 hypothetical protein [Caldibacillus sp. 210928-DFI.2.22]MCB7072103.1 hypothetical protein [Caldibacillus sp. 210928-DFI.2.18]
MLRKVTCLVISITLLFGILGSSVSAQTIPTRNKGLTQEQTKIAEIIMRHLENYTDENGNKQLKITNKNELKQQINNSGINLITFEQLETAVSNFNYYMAAGENAVTEAADDISSQLATLKNTTKTEVGTMKLTCSDIVSIIGLIHAGNYGLAALLLGVTGPAAFIVPFLISAAYTAGSVLGCKL